MLRDCALVAGPALGAILLASTTSAGTLDEVKARGRLNCGIHFGLAGFASQDNGDWRGFDVALCRAIATAVLGDTDAVEFVNLTGTTRFEALADGEIDVLSRNTTWTFSRDVELGFTFSGISYYDGQGFMVPASRDISSATELGGATICVTTDTTTELNLADFFDANGIEFEKRSIPTNAEALEQYVDGACDAFTSDASGLAAARATLDDPGAHVILPEIISKEPLGPVVRQDDPDWADLVRWVLNAMIAAEEYGVTSENVGRQARSAVNPEVQRLLGAEGNQGEMLGLDPDWAVRIIRDVGNYGEVFEDTIGANSEIDLARGLNAQWTDGGLLYAPPFR